MNKKSQSNFAIALLILAIIFVIFLFVRYSIYYRTGNVIENNPPELIINNLIYDKEFSIFNGCITKIRGTISNVGETTAKDVKIHCELIGSGKGIISQTKELNNIPRYSNINFNFNIDNNCPNPKSISCVATCINC